MITYLFTPDLMGYDDLQKITVGEARKVLLNEILDKIKTSTAEDSHLCLLILGGRGTGKSHMLGMIYYSILNSDLSDAVKPIKFSEEEYSIYDLRDFFEKILKGLGESLRQADSDAAIDQAVNFLLRMKEKKKILLLLDNVNLIFGQIGSELGKLRSIIQEKNPFLIVAAAPTVFRQITDYGEPFYNFFELRALPGLDDNEAVELIRKRFELDKRTDFDKKAGKDAWRIKAINILTGGNPRLIHLLYEIMSKEGTIPDVESHLLKLLDEMTPLYQLKMSDLSGQQRKILDTIALAERPLTPTEVSQRCNIDVKTVNPQISRLENEGYVEPVKLEKKKRETHYEIRERLFRIWRQMRQPLGASRIKMLTDFLKIWYRSEELLEQFSMLEKEMHAAMTSRAYAEAERYAKHLTYIVEAMPSGLIKIQKSSELIRETFELGDEEKAKTQIQELWSDAETHPLGPAIALMTEIRMNQHFDRKNATRKDARLYRNMLENVDVALPKLESNYEKAFAYILKAMALHGLRKNENALDTVNAGLDINNKFVMLWWWRAHLLRILKRLDEAMVAIERGLTLGERLEFLPEQWAILFEKKEFNLALESVNEFLQSNPKDIDALAFKSAVLLSLNRCEESVKNDHDVCELARLEHNEELLANASVNIAFHNVVFFSEKVQAGKLDEAEKELESLTKVLGDVDTRGKRFVCEATTSIAIQLASDRRFDSAERLVMITSELDRSCAIVLKPVAKALEYIRTKRSEIFEELQKEDRQLAVNIIKRLSPQIRMPDRVYETLRG